MAIPIDPASIGKRVKPTVPIVGDARRVLQKLNAALREQPPVAADARAAWWQAVADWRAQRCLVPGIWRVGWDVHGEQLRGRELGREGRRLYGQPAPSGERGWLGHLLLAWGDGRRGVGDAGREDRGAFFRGVEGLGDGGGGPHGRLRCRRRGRDERRR